MTERGANETEVQNAALCECVEKKASQTGIATFVLQFQYIHTLHSSLN